MTQRPRRRATASRGSDSRTLVGLEPGLELGGCRLDARLGAGGYGEVWRARHLAFDQDFAMKVMAPELSDHASARMRFLREARRLLELDHPGISRIFDCGVDEQALDRPLAWIRIELLEGPDLDTVLAERGALPPHEALRILAPVAEALDHAHRLGFVHRDVKPANIMFTADPDQGGRPKLIDFGIAAEVERSVEATGGTVEDLQVAGTPPYMSPEQIRGRHPTPAMDIWALGVTLYQVVTDLLPFPGPASQRRHQILDLDPQPIEDSSLEASTLAAWNHGLACALAKDPGARPTSASALLAILARSPLEHAEPVDDEAPSDGSTGDLEAAQVRGAAPSISHPAEPEPDSVDDEAPSDLEPAASSEGHQGATWGGWFLVFILVVMLLSATDSVTVANGY